MIACSTPEPRICAGKVITHRVGGEGWKVSRELDGREVKPSECAKLSGHMQTAARHILKQDFMSTDYTPEMAKLAAMDPTTSMFNEEIIAGPLHLHTHLSVLLLWHPAQAQTCCVTQHFDGVEILNHCIKPPKTSRLQQDGPPRMCHAK